MLSAFLEQIRINTTVVWAICCNQRPQRHLDGLVTALSHVLGVACEILGWVGMGHVASSFNICAWTGCGSIYGTAQNGNLEAYQHYATPCEQVIMWRGSINELHLTAQNEAQGACPRTIAGRYTLASVVGWNR